MHHYNESIRFKVSSPVNDPSKKNYLYKLTVVFAVSPRSHCGTKVLNAETARSLHLTWNKQLLL